MTRATNAAHVEVATMPPDHRIEGAILHWYAGPIDLLRRMIRRDDLSTVGVGILHSDHYRRLAALIPVRGNSAPRICEQGKAYVRHLLQHDTRLAPWRPLVGATSADHADASSSA